MTDAALWGEAAVDLIEACLHTPSEEHRVECEEEWWFLEVGEQPAMYLSQAIVNGSMWANAIAWMSWAYQLADRR